MKDANGQVRGVRRVPDAGHPVAASAVDAPGRPPIANGRFDDLLLEQRIFQRLVAAPVEVSEAEFRGAFGQRARARQLEQEAVARERELLREAEELEKGS